MKRADVRALVEQIGIVPAVRVASENVARFAAEAVGSGGIPIVEIEMTIPGAIEVIRCLVKHMPDMVVGAGAIYDAETARRCIGVGASFLTTDGLDLDVVEVANKQEIAVWPAALTPTEIVSAWKAGPDFVKIFPCAPVGGDVYVKTIRKAFAQVPLIAAGGVNQKTAHGFILSGASALGIGGELIPDDAVRLRQADRIRELAQRFRRFVHEARAQIKPQAKNAARNAGL